MNANYSSIYFYAEIAMVTRIAQDYQTNFRNHIASNF